MLFPLPSPPPPTPDAHRKYPRNSSLTLRAFLKPAPTSLAPGLPGCRCQDHEHCGFNGAPASFLIIPGPPYSRATALKPPDETTTGPLVWVHQALPTALRTHMTFACMSGPQNHIHLQFYALASSSSPRNSPRSLVSQPPSALPRRDCLLLDHHTGATLSCVPSAFPVLGTCMMLPEERLKGGKAFICSLNQRAYKVAS